MVVALQDPGYQDHTEREQRTETCEGVVLECEE